MGEYIGEYYIWVMKADSRSLDYRSFKAWVSGSAKQGARACG